MLATPICSDVAAAKGPAGGGSGHAASSTPSPPHRHCPDDGLLCRGDRCDAVAAVQAKLALRADGVYGAETERAVAAFQRRHAGLHATGVVDLPTWSALFGARVLVVNDSPSVERALAGLSPSAAGTGASRRTASGSSGMDLLCVQGVPGETACHTAGGQVVGASVGGAAQSARSPELVGAALGARSSSSQVTAGRRLPPRRASRRPVIVSRVPGVAGRRGWRGLGLG
jgi:Putative peptidoglycan binding domain